MKLFTSCCAVVVPGLLMAGCGKPPPPQGPGGDFPVASVVAPVLQEDIEEKVFLVGSLASPDRTDVVAEASGKLTALTFEKGQRVEAGAELVRIDDAKIRARMAEVDARLQFAKAEHQRISHLRESGTATQQEFDQAEANLRMTEANQLLLQEELADTVVTAPFDGLVGNRYVSPGQFVSAGQGIATLVRMDPLEIAFDVPERYIGRIERGRTVRITTPAFPGKTFTGTVTYLSPGLDDRTRTLRVEATLPNSDYSLRPGMFGNAQLVLGLRENALTIPAAALRYRGDAASVVVRNAEGVAEFRPVTPGTRGDGRVEILEGLSVGEVVVVEGHQKMGPGSAIMIAPESERYGITPPSPEATEPSAAAEEPPPEA